MHIIITLAGHSRRFHEAGYKGPKFMLPVDGTPMISHVVNMFSTTDYFYFILNSEQVKDYPDLPDQLRTLRKRVSIVVIPPHEHGPVWSALQVKDIPPEEPIIVSYCDFFVRWNYSKFLREADGYDAAIPAFRNFHPASFGKTYYAYMRANQTNDMLELREKSNFTAERHKEPASAGIYYFRSQALFQHYAERLMQAGHYDGLKEGYVSLLANPMVRDGLKVRVTEVEKFICLGTPEDYEQYTFWSAYFRTSITTSAPTQNQINLIPMAGKGSRFKQFGYRVGKPLIQVRGKPMIVAACESFPQTTQWIFLPREEDLQKHPLAPALKRFQPECIIIPVDHETSGQAATCLLAAPHLKTDASLFIASCDYETRFSAAAWKTIIEDPSIDGAIWTIRLGGMLAKNPTAFAYCVTAADGNTVERVVEKSTISEHPECDPLVVGSFWFRRTEDFMFAARTAIEKNYNVNGEHYVGNSINLLIERGRKFVIFDIEQWISYGDPFELEVYQYWEEFFATHAQPSDNVAAIGMI